MSTATTFARPHAATLAGERFYVRMAAVFLVVGVVGFSPTYWVPLLRGTLSVPPLAHVHALLFYGWLLLFLKQSSLAASGRLVRHREMGVLGVAVATGMCFVGLAMAISSIKIADAAGFGEAGRRFAIVPITAALLFAAMFVTALLNVRRPEVHKRVLIAATAALLQAAAGRWFVLFLAPAHAPGVVLSPPPVFVSVMPGLVVDLLIVWAMIHDHRTTGRVHRTYWIWGAVIVAVQVLRVPVSMTNAWMHVPQWLMALAP
ncbi:MAG: hypothetical protein ABI818_13295 [Acidobacteriota bacterium]